jgi:hypothetical protein
MSESLSSSSSFNPYCDGCTIACKDAYEGVPQPCQHYLHFTGGGYDSGWHYIGPNLEFYRSRVSFPEVTFLLSADPHMDRSQKCFGYDFSSSPLLCSYVACFVKASESQSGYGAGTILRAGINFSSKSDLTELFKTADLVVVGEHAQALWGENGFDDPSFTNPHWVPNEGGTLIYFYSQSARDPNDGLRYRYLSCSGPDSYVPVNPAFGGANSWPRLS